MKYNNRDMTYQELLAKAPNGVSVVICFTEENMLQRFIVVLLMKNYKVFSIIIINCNISNLRKK
jgi:hypothetical protein